MKIPPLFIIIDELKRTRFFCALVKLEHYRIFVSLMISLMRESGVELRKNARYAKNRVKFNHNVTLLEKLFISHFIDVRMAADVT
jgi:hypothetical protein